MKTFIAAVVGAIAVFILTYLLLPVLAQERRYYDDPPTKPAWEQEEERRKKEYWDQQETDKYGCPKQAPYSCTTDPFTLQMSCGCGGGFGGRF